MTIDEVEVALEAGQAAISYLGRVGTRTHQRYACSITPSLIPASRWKRAEWCMRGKGNTAEEALLDALAKLAALLLTREEER